MDRARACGGQPRNARRFTARPPMLRRGGYTFRPYVHMLAPRQVRPHPLSWVLSWVLSSGRRQLPRRPRSTTVSRSVYPRVVVGLIALPRQHAPHVLQRLRWGSCNPPAAVGETRTLAHGQITVDAEAHLQFSFRAEDQSAEPSLHIWRIAEPAQYSSVAVRTAEQVPTTLNHPP